MAVLGCAVVGLLSSPAQSIGFASLLTYNQGQQTTAAASTVGSIAGNVNLIAGNQFRLVGSDIQTPNGDVNIIAKQVDITEARQTSASQNETKFKQSGLTVSISNPVVSAVQSAEQTIEAASNTSSARMQGLAAASVALKGYNTYNALTSAMANPAAAADITINVSVGSSKSQSNNASQADTAKGSSITAGNNATLISGSSINLNAANVDAKTGQASLIAGGPVTIAGLTTTQTQNSSSASSSSGFFSSKSSSASSSSTTNLYEGSAVSGNTVLIQSGTVGANGQLVKGTGAVDVVGSSIAATGDVLINSASTVTVLGGQAASSSSKASSQSQSGLFSSGTSLTFGSRSSNGQQTSQDVTTQRALIGSNQGSVTVNAQGSYTQGAADVLAATDITVIAPDIQLVAQTDTNRSASQTSTRQSGLSVGIGSGGALGTVNTAAGNISAASTANSSRASTLRSIAATRDIYDAGQAIAAGGDPLANASINISIGASQSSSSSSSQSRTPQTATLAAGGTVSLQADKQTGVIGTEGTLIQGKVVELSANTINLGAAQTTSANQSANNASGWSLGVNISAAGISATASANQSKGNANGASADNLNTRIQAGNTATITSTGDTTLSGAVVQAGTIKADIGGKLTIESLQDTQTQSANQSSSGFAISVPITGGNFSASVNASQGKGQGTYASVNQQSGLMAGSGGFDVNVQGTTTLKGGVIASTASPDKNQLTTQALVTSDISNSAAFNASAVGGGLSVGSSGIPVPKLDIPQNASGNQASTSQSAIAPGSITLTGGDGAANQTQIAALNRDTTQSTPLQKLPNLSQLLTNQAQDAAALNAAGPAVFKTIGDVAQARQQDARVRQQDAQQRVDANPNDSKAKADLSQAKQDAEYWKEGGTGKAILHGLGGLVLGGPAGAAGAITNEKLLPALIAKSKEVFPDPLPTGNKETDEAAQAKVNAQRTDYLKVGSTLIGVASGGAAGGNVAQTATVNNYLKHDEALLRAQLTEKLQSCKGNDCQTIRSQIEDINKIERWRDQQIEQACNNPNSADCGRLNKELQTALASYTGKDLTALGVRDSAGKTLSLSDMYQNRINNPVGYGVVLSIIKNGLDLVIAPAQLSYTLTRSAMGDAQAQQDLRQTLVGIRDTITDPSGAIVNKLEAADRAEAAGNPAEAARIRTDLVILVGGTTAGAAALGRSTNNLWKSANSLDNVLGDVKPSTNGFISTRQLTEEGMPARLTSTELADLSKMPQAANTTARGNIGDAVMDSYVARNGYKVLDGKCGAQCFDGVYLKDGKVYINEVKPMSADGSIQLSGPSGELATQMTPDWIKSRSAILENGTPAQKETARIIRQAISDQSLVRTVTGVNTSGATMVKLSGLVK